MSESASALAAEALAEIESDPRRARSRAMRALDLAGASEPEAMSVATRVLGLVSRANDLPGAERWFRKSAAIARRAGLPARQGEALIGLSLTQVMAGRSKAGLKTLDAASLLVSGSSASHLHLQRALILTRLGRFEAALEDHSRALVGMRADGDREGESRVLNNRGILFCLRGELAAAEVDLQGAMRICIELGQPLAAALTAHNLGWVAGRRGDVPAALAAFDDAQRRLDELGDDGPDLLLDRGELLLSVRLIDEARATSERAAMELTRLGLHADAAEALLLLSHCALFAGEDDVAIDAANRARKSFARSDRAPWIALADYAVLRARWHRDGATRRGWTSARAVAGALAEAGWAVPSLDARLIAARMAVSIGMVDAAREDLALAATARRRGPADLRARAWLAEAMRRRADGDRRGSLAALRAGSRAVDVATASMGATELRAHVAGHGGELADLGIELALADRNPRGVLGWAERHRASWLRLRPARPPAPGRVQDALALLRSVVGEVEEVTLAGGDVRPVLHRQSELEQTVVDAFRVTPGGLSQLAEVAPVRAIVEEVTAAGRALVEFVAHGDALHAVVVHGGRVTLHDAGRLADVSRELTALHFALRRLARIGLPAASRQAAAASAQHSADALDGQLIRPLLGRVGAAPLIVVPTGPLHGLAWGALPALVERSFTVAPSAGVWVRSRRADTTGTGRVVAVAGPGLPHALEEVRQVAKLHPASTALVPPFATAPAVLAAIDGASIAHLAAHGRFRSDNPLFTAVSLADGPLMVYDLESLERAPNLVVLSACETGGAGGSTGDELLGMAAALLALGSTHLVASSLPVPDDDASSFMVDVHRQLAAGAGPADALASARGSRQGGPSIDVAAASFTCWGVG